MARLLKSTRCFFLTRVLKLLDVCFQNVFLGFALGLVLLAGEPNKKLRISEKIADGRDLILTRVLKLLDVCFQDVFLGLALGLILLARLPQSPSPNKQARLAV